MKSSHTNHYINGQWVVGEGPVFHSINPASGHIIYEGHEATEDEINSAFKFAEISQNAWKKLSATNRADYLNRFAQIVDKRKEELTHLISLESGKPLWESATEVVSVITKVKLSLQAYQERCAEIQTKGADATSVLRYKPHGVVAVLGPFNFPAHLSNGHIIPALLAGNAVIYKPSELTPAVAGLIMQCWHESGIPAGVIQCVQGGLSSGKYLLNCPIQGVFFTGSYQTGQAINQQFSDRPEVILALEMGGNNPLVIDEVLNLNAAIYLTLLSTLITAGQRCTCARRVIIPNTEFGDQFLQQFILACQRIKIGSFTDEPEPFMGPVIRHQHALSHLEKQQNLLNAGGRSLLTMSLLKANTGLLSPGIIDMTEITHPIDEEIFAPLVQIYRYNNFEEALNIANQTQYGLAAGLLSDSINRYHQFYETVNAGLINWNRPTTGASSALPFGGIGKSGNHRPSAYFAADYCAYSIASMENNTLSTPQTTLPGVIL